MNAKSVIGLGALLCACDAPLPQETPIGAAAQALREMQGTRTGVALRLGQISGGAFRFNPEQGSLQVRFSGCSGYVEGAQLRGRSFRGKTVEGAAVDVQIVDVLPHNNRSQSPPSAMADAYDYTLLVNGQPLCPGGQPAVVVPGDLAAPPYVYDPYSRIANFACGGAVTKCVDWGYKPWRVGGVSWPTPGNAFGQCLFMVRADYCGQDVSNTLDGTMVDVYDVGLVRPVNQRAPGDPPLELEALWAPASVSPARPAALCLTKRRWDALPLKGTCDLRVSDPRLRGPIIPGCAAPPPTGGGQYCGEKTLDEWLQVARAQYGSPTLGLLVNDSSYNDVGLYRWQDMGGAGGYTTTGYDIYKMATGAGLVPLRPSLRYRCFEGRLYTAAELRIRPDLVPLYSYASAAGEHVTTTATTPPTGYAAGSQRLEGYVVGPTATGTALPPEAAGLYLWQDGGKYVTSTSATDRPPAAQLLGYMPRSQAGGVPLCDTTAPGTFSSADFPSPLQITCPAPTSYECESGRGCADVLAPPPACGKAGISAPGPTCYPLGDNVTRYSAVDPRGQTAQCTATLKAVDTRAPVVVGAPSAPPLWPPNHRYVTVSLLDCGIQAQDQCEGALDATTGRAEITCVTADEPLPGSGPRCDPDIVILDATRVKLRAERLGSGDGRVYRIGFTVKDRSGNAGAGVCTVTVPHDQGAGRVAVDSGVQQTVCR